MGRKSPNKQSIIKNTMYFNSLAHSYIRIPLATKQFSHLKYFLKGKGMIKILTLKVRLSFRGQAKTVKRVDLSRYIDCNHGFLEK